jgi:hypothetical protein
LTEKREYEHLKVELSDNELRQKGEELARKICDIQRLESRLETAKATIGGDIKPLGSVRNWRRNGATKSVDY